MSFAQDKARMVRILRACQAPAQVVAEFKGLCGYWQAGDSNTAEELLLDACKRHNFIAPWQDGEQEIEFRPNALGSENPDRLPDHSTSPDGEQGYRRGYHQGLTYVLNELAGGTSMAEVREFAKKVEEWRRQVVQLRGAPPGCPRPANLPSKWDRA